VCDADRRAPADQHGRSARATCACKAYARSLCCSGRCGALHGWHCTRPTEGEIAQWFFCADCAMRNICGVRAAVGAHSSRPRVRAQSCAAACHPGHTLSAEQRGVASCSCFQSAKCQVKTSADQRAAGEPWEDIVARHTADKPFVDTARRAPRSKDRWSRAELRCAALHCGRQAFPHAPDSLFMDPKNTAKHPRWLSVKWK
jgi:hypothetical protein